MRTKHSIKNISINLFSQIVIIMLGFLSRKVFLDSLGSEYLGINGLLTNVLSAMVLIEGGIGISIVYNLYKPLAEGNKEDIIALVQLYKKAYTVLAVIMVCISYFIYPMIDKIIVDGSNVKGVQIVYFLFVAKNVVCYLYGYKWALINADQRGYHLTKNNLIFQVISIIGKIIILILTKNYMLYLLIEFVLFIIQNICNSMIVNKLYPYIKTKEKYNIDKDIKVNINKNVRAMFVQNIGSYAISSTDNIIVSTFINVSLVGIYSNYTMIIDQLSSLVSTVINGVSNSVGNLIAVESKEKVYFIFNISYFMSFLIYSISFIFLFNLTEPFISWWLGKEYILDKFTFIVLLINFYISGIRNSVVIFKSKAGLFSQDKYAVVVQGVINLVFSIILVKKLGLVGVFLGTTISYIALSFWNQPRILYKYVFNKSLVDYFKKYILYLILTILVCLITTNICNIFVVGDGFVSLVFKGIICITTPSLIYIFIFYKTNEFKYLLNTINPVIIFVKMRIEKLVDRKQGVRYD